MGTQIIFLVLKLVSSALEPVVFGNLEKIWLKAYVFVNTFIISSALKTVQIGKKDI